MKPLAKAFDGMRQARLSLSGTSWNKLVVSSNRVSKHYCHDHLDRSDGERWNAEVSALLLLQKGKFQIDTPRVYRAKEGSVCMSRVLNEISDPHNQFKNLTTSQQRDVLQQAGRVLRQIHSFTVPANHGLPSLTPEQLKQSYEKFFISLRNDSFDGVNLGKLPLSQLATIVSKVVSSPETVVLNHGDFWLNNLCFSNSWSVSAVVDWEFSFIGTPYVDLGRTNLYVVKRYENGSYFWQGYGKEVDPTILKSFTMLEIVRRLALFR